MQPIRSFIVRLYRRDRRGIAGVVEDVRSGRAIAFSSLAGLWAALTRPARGSTTPHSPSSAAPDAAAHDVIAHEEPATTRRDTP